MVVVMFRGGEGGGSFLTLGGFVTTLTMALMLCDFQGWVSKGHAAPAWLSLGEASHYVGNLVALRLPCWRGVPGHSAAELPPDQQRGLPAMSMNPVNQPA